MTGLKDARIVIIGGGAIGCSIAYHLAKAGESDVVVLEKSGLTQGATWHAAGLVGQLRSKRNLTRMMRDSAVLYARLSDETGIETDWKKVGSLRLASSPDRWREIKRAHGQARAFGLEIELIGPQEAHDLFPLIETKNVVGAAFIPGDGYIDPSGLTQAFARGARQNGGDIREGVLVTDFIIEKGRITGVVTDHGTIGCETVVNAAGLWARRVAAMAGVAVPAGVVEHQYMVTEKDLGLDSDAPTLRDPDNLFYAKPEVGGLAIGGWEKAPPAVGDDRLPFAFGRELFPGDFDRFEEIALPVCERIPRLNDVGIRNLINGPIPISPDGEPIMGKVPELQNLFVACGFTSGIAASGGAGKCMANWILEDDPGMDLWAFDVRRFGPHHSNTRFLHERAAEAYSRYYSVHWPNDELASARPARGSPLYDRLKAQGAVYGSKFGWERPNWFAGDGTAPVDQPSFGRANWFDTVGEEHRAVRERVALIDQSSFTKFEISGPGAGSQLNRIAANDIDRPPGSAVYTQLLNDRGGIEADLTIMRTGAESFYVVTGSGFGVRDGDWIRSHLLDDGTVDFVDVTASRAVINLCGPRSRDVLEKVSDADLSNDAFPYMTCRDIDIGYAPVRAVRITYVGELGWELHVPAEFAATLYDSLNAAGADFGIQNVGYRAIDSLRLEKRYLYWGADIGPDYSPLQAGLAFCVAWDKGNFTGREALLRERERGITTVLNTYLLDHDAPVMGGEPIICDGKVIGITTSGNYGYSVGKNIVLGYVPVEFADREAVEIECFGQPFGAQRSFRPPYDPDRKTVRA